jgi:hypothetical protein
MKSDVNTSVSWTYIPLAVRAGYVSVLFTCRRELEGTLFVLSSGVRGVRIAQVQDRGRVATTYV